MTANKTSHRYFSADEFDVDAFKLIEQEKWALFVYLKSDLVDWERLKKKIHDEFTLGALAVIGGAIKTKKNSQALEPTFFSEEASYYWVEHQGLSLKIEMRNVLNPGIFLDQQLNRTKLEPLYSPGCELLNLFSYTGAFSAHAASMGTRTTSVDVSKRYLEWEKENHIKNGTMSLAKTIKADARDFMKRAVKKSLKWNVIVLDPPTFSRSEGEVFKVRDSLLELATQCVQSLALKGVLLVSCNDSQWIGFHEDFFEFSKTHRLRMEPGDLPPEFSKIRHYPLKSVFLYNSH